MYSISIFSPGRNYAGLVGRSMNVATAAACVANIILGDIEGREPLDSERSVAKRNARALLAYAPSSITLDSGHRLTIDPESDRV